jgi:hypothetical protein
MKDGVGVNCARGGVIVVAIKALDRKLLFGLDVLKTANTRNDYESKFH